VVIEHYIKDKEEHGDRAISVSAQRVHQSELFTSTGRPVAAVLQSLAFIISGKRMRKRTSGRILRIASKKGCHRIFYWTANRQGGKRMFTSSSGHLVWQPSDVSREVTTGAAGRFQDFTWGQGQDFGRIQASTTRVKPTLKSGRDLYKGQ